MSGSRHVATALHVGPYKPRTGRTGPCINHAPAIHCTHGHIIQQAKGCQTVQNVN